MGDDSDHPMAEGEVGVEGFYYSKPRPPGELRFDGLDLAGRN